MTGRPQKWFVTIAVPVLALVAVVVTRAIEEPSDAPVERGDASTIVIKNFAFAPSKLTVKTGTSVEVTNGDGTVHTLSAKDGTFDTGDLDGGATTRVTLERSGIFTYYCNIHNSMTGVLEVR